MQHLTRKHFEAIADNRDRVMIGLESCADEKGFAKIGQVKLAKKVGLAPATVARMLIELENRKMIVRSRPSAKGSHGSVPHTIQIMAPPRS